MALTGCNKVTDEFKTEVEGEINERISVCIYLLLYLFYLA